MQRPTHPRLHVRDARDAQTVFEAVRRGSLRPVTRRLNEIERAMFIQSGAIFVWEESEDELGLKRWTDGRVWSQSRMREPYLFYDEKLPNDPTSDTAAQQASPQAVFRFVDGSSRGGGSSSIISHFDRSAHRHNHVGLIKQAYSALVMSGSSRPRKWHLTAYFTYADLQNLPTIDHDQLLRSITVPPGIYRSGKARSRNSDATLDTAINGMAPSLVSSASSSPPATPMMTSSNNVPPLYSLPPLHAAVPHDGTSGYPKTNGASRDSRSREDERVIGLLN
ncbi:hypothetical protein SCHPADRAFT_856464, partial [Schizopora paradoxa]